MFLNAYAALATQKNKTPNASIGVVKRRVMLQYLLKFAKLSAESSNLVTDCDSPKFF